MDGVEIAQKPLASEVVTPSTPPPIVLTSRPEPPLQWLRDMLRFREVLVMMTRKDFQVRYKRASFGVVWAVAVPALQAAVMAIVFSHVVRTGTGPTYPIYVMSGVIAFSYFSIALPSATTAIVDGHTLTDKVWFPRALLVIVPCLSNLVGLLVTLGVLVVVMPFFHVAFGLRMFLLLPATALLILFTVALGLVLSALQVYFRDVKFIVMAALLVWMYVTPVVYPPKLLGRFAPFIEANPLTGVVTLFHMATVGNIGNWAVPVWISLGSVALLSLIGICAHSRLDRLFVDKL